MTGYRKAKLIFKRYCVLESESRTIPNFIPFLIDFLEREEGREGERGRERERERDIDVLLHLFVHSLAASCVCPDWGLRSQPGIEPTALAYKDDALAN